MNAAIEGALTISSHESPGTITNMNPRGDPTGGTMTLP
jgi:hypothetical protein